MKLTFQRPERYGFISHFRGFAALSVVFFHSFGANANHAIWPPLETLRHLAIFGWMGVHVFFVISGYCLAEKMSSLARQGRGAGDFLVDRFWRILPPYWLALLFVMALGVAATLFNQLPWYSAFPPSWAAGAADFLLVQPLTGTPSLLLVSWTLVCEAVFYLVIALFLIAWPWVGGFGGVMLLASFLTVLGIHPDMPLHFLSPPFWTEFWLGMIAYTALAGRRANTGLALILLVGMLAWWQPAGIFSRVHLMAVATSLLIVVLQPLDARLTANRWLGWLGFVGLWSYSLYLIHAPLLSRIHNLARRRIAPDSPLFGAVWLASIALALAGAYLFYRLVEEPIERWRHRRAPAPRLQVA